MKWTPRNLTTYQFPAFDRLTQPSSLNLLTDRLSEYKHLDAKSMFNLQVIKMEPLPNLIDPKTSRTPVQKVRKSNSTICTGAEKDLGQKFPAPFFLDMRLFSQPLLYFETAKLALLKRERCSLLVFIRQRYGC